MRVLIMAGVLVCTVSSGLPAAVSQSAPPGCAQSERHSEFGFWVGEWNVYDREGRFAGRNDVSLRSGDCLIVEEWESAGGGDGTSMNFVDPESGHWRQIWVSANTHIAYSGGLNARGEMILRGEISYFGGETETTADFRGKWTPLETGRVVQHFQQYDPGSDSWQDWFAATYVPRGDDPNGTEPDADATGPVIETLTGFD
ncbi:hypothetical protein [Marinicauda sp. Alg238-R41]|uniref:hypothetical protein n=1 Tax=Marinicauda sp. Alg238-R41 TaxID=2993447 RepID=UPI0022E7BC2C|nr:hypothetical protein [Marinicauda sp. Alg238-R41]